MTAVYAPKCSFFCAVVFTLLLASSLLGAEPILLDGQQVHPTRLLARAKPGRAPALPAAAKPFQRGKGRGLTPRWYVLDEAIPGKGDALSRLRQRLQNLRASGDYEFVEPDYIVELDATPDDAALADGRLWGLHNTGQNDGTAGVDVNAMAAWAFTTGSTNVVVGVIDTGIRYTHQDLASQMWRNPGEVPGNGVDDDGNGYVDDVFGIDAVYNTGNPFDEAGHGTHVAGTIGAAANNGYPHVGVAPQVRLMTCRFIALRSGYTSDAIECINYAVANGARILNNSWGSSSFSHALYETIAAANEAGVLFVAAAGNRGRDFDVLPNYPSGYELDNVVSVAALDRQGNLASFSSYGRQRVHLGAPGVDIFSSYAGADDSYRLASGTSMATPHVAGAAALLWAHYPQISMNDVRRRLLAGVTPTHSLLEKTVTGGRVDAHRALTISEDGSLEIAVAPVGGGQLLPGSTRAFVVQVSDLRSVTNATVTAQVNGIGSVVFANDGLAPDAHATDDQYSVSLVVPSNQSNLVFYLTVEAPGFAATNITASFPIVLRPPNDDFAARIHLAGSVVTLSGNNQLATREVGEPLHGGLSGKHSAWWSWTAPSDGFAMLASIEAPFTFQVAVYTGATLPALDPVAAYHPLGLGRKAATFRVRAGEQYHFAVDGFRDAAGDFSFSIAHSNAPPTVGVTNDFFALREPLTGWYSVHGANNLLAGMEMFEPSFGPGSGRTIWWTWTAPGDARVTFQPAGIDFSVLAAAYLGQAIHDLTRFPLVSAGMTNDAPTLSFNAAAGRSYQFVVDSRTSNRGAITAFLQAAPQLRPSNDDFAARAELNGLPSAASGVLAGATWEHREPESPLGQGSVWYRWRAAADGDVLASLSSAGTNATMAVFAGELPGALTRVDFPAGIDRIAWHAAAGAEYAIRVSSVGMEEPAFALLLEAAADPSILLEPHNRSVFSGRTIRLVARTAGAGPLAHQWFHNGQPLPEQTNAILRVARGSAEHAGSYTLVASNALGVATATAEVIVEPLVSSVGVFSDSRFIDNSEGLGGTELHHIESAVERVGYQPSRVTNINYLAAPALVIPNQRASVARGLHPSAREMLADYVRDGGLLLVAGSFYQHDAELLDSLFGFGVAGADTIGSRFYFRTPQAEETTFANVPDTIESHNHSTLDTRTLPAEAVSLFQREDRALAALLPYGDGHVVFLGPTFYGVRPRGYIDGGWLALIEAALRVGVPPLDRPPVFESIPEGLFINAQSGATLSASAYGSSPLSYQWFREEQPVLLGTNSVLALPATGTNQSGYYYLVVSNAFGLATSEVARVTVTPPGLHVTVFDDPAFVRTAGGATNESDALQASIRYFGYDIQTVTNFNGLTNRIVVIPRLANGDLAAVLDPAELASLSAHVAGGGTLILFGDEWGREIGLLQRLFGWEIGNWRVDSEAGTGHRRPLPRRSRFHDGPDVVMIRESFARAGGYYALEANTLPPGSLHVFDDPEDQALVADMPWGRGRVIHIGWNWQQAVPLGSYDDNWLLVLAAALAQGWDPQPPPSLALVPSNPNIQWHLRGTPHAPAELLWSPDLSDWTIIQTNIIPASGTLRRPIELPSQSSNGFFRVREW